jgi:hypothetical protein
MLECDKTNGAEYDVQGGSEMQVIRFVIYNQQMMFVHPTTEYIPETARKSQGVFFQP